MISLGFRVRTKGTVPHQYLHGEPTVDFKGYSNSDPWPTTWYHAKTRPVPLVQAQRLLGYTGIGEIVEVLAGDDIKGNPVTLERVYDPKT